ncbi:cupin domain-containing protein [Paraburkholderia diazotrophica]|uniref:cupin domain-containing protein n=1 Tax=Paraburkholderia diazotrophica TaxID=667676 RepID=UPI0031711259
MNFVDTVFASTAAACIALGASHAAHAQGIDSRHEHISPAFQTAIANLPGKTMTAIVVDYKPGGVSRSHRHGRAFVVGYVLQGEIRSKVDDGEERVYHAGESWTEAPGAHHLVSENASKTKPAKLLAIFVADDNDKNLVIWDKK